MILSFIHQSVSMDKTEIHLKVDSIRSQYDNPAVVYAAAISDSIIIQGTIGYRNNQTKEKIV